MNDLPAILIMAIVQGIAEFLPVSSSGHLAVLGDFFGLKDTAQTSIFLHGGTLVAITIFYFKQLIKMTKWQSRHTVLLLIMGSIPAGIIGGSLTLLGLVEFLSDDLGVPAIGFIITGFILLYGMKSRDNDISLNEMPMKTALLVGAAQGLAILPGISRSGSTIAAGLKCGIKKEDCAEFSFLLAIPAIAGAVLLEIISLFRHSNVHGAGRHYINLGIGFAVSAVIGYISLFLLVRMLRSGKLKIFAWYLFAIGAALLIWRIKMFF